MLAGRTHPTTTFEIFFDLVLVFALTRVIAFMAESLSALTLAQGLLLLFLLLYAWTLYAWVANLVRADVGPVRAVMFVAMAAIFVAALVIPHAWQQSPDAVRRAAHPRDRLPWSVGPCSS